MIQLLNKLVTAKAFQKVVNKNQLSRGFGRLADSRGMPRGLLELIIRKYIQAYAIDMSDFDCDIRNVGTFNEFFSRQLKPGARPFASGIACPAEGYVAAFGSLREGMLHQIKGQSYTLRDLLMAEPSFSGKGSYLTVYLSPADYHRFHAPFDMEIESVRYIPGTLHSTSFETLRVQKNLYCENERFIVAGRCAYGRFYYIPVGAIVVGRIVLSFADLCSNKKNAQPESIVYREPVVIKKGGEVGYFQMGSTLVLALESDCLTGVDRQPGAKIRLGETIAS